MGQTGKRSRQPRNHDNEGKGQKKRQISKESSDNDELVVYRILCPDSVIGSVIGKNGKVINSIRQRTNAKVKVVDPYPGADKRVILIYCYIRNRDLDVDENDDSEPVCLAQNALLKVHDAIVDALDSDKKSKEEANILVPASQAASIIGKSGAVIKRLRSTTKAGIKVSPKDPNEVTHSCAMSFDNFVQITGDSDAVRKALFAVSTIMYKFPSKETIPLETSVAEHPQSIVIPSEVPIYPAGNIYVGSEAAMSSTHAGLSVLGATPHVPEFSGLTDGFGALPVYPAPLPVLPGYGASTSSGELVVRVLCPSDKIGRVIGRGGMTIKNIRQESGAQIEVNDKDDREESLITITSTEATDDVKSAAVEAVLQLQSKINDEDEDNVNLRLLVPTKVIGCLIGKGGSIVNDMRKRTKADIRISKGDKPKRASSTDELVEVFGEVGNLRDALVQIVLRLREDVLRDREDGQNSHKDSKRTIPHADPLYANGLSLPALLPSMHQVASLGYDQRAEVERGLGVIPGNNIYGYSSFQAGEDSYPARSSYSSKGYGRPLPHLEMTIPANALSKVMGKGGTNLDNIRKISGAHVEIVDSKSSHFDRVAHISGTPEQRQSAENLIKAFIMST